MNNCPWCGIGIDSNEKFCSGCGHGNVNYKDIHEAAHPFTNIGERVLEYEIQPFKKYYYWEVPRNGILRRLIILTPYPLARIQAIENGSFYIVNQVPRVIPFVYTGSLSLEEISDLRIIIETTKEQGAIITLETDPTPGVYYGVSGFRRR